MGPRPRGRGCPPAGGVYPSRGTRSNRGVALPGLTVLSALPLADCRKLTPSIWLSRRMGVRLTVRDLQACKLSDAVYQPARLLVGFDISRGCMFGEVDRQNRHPDLAGVDGVLEGQLHAVGLALDAIEQDACHGLFTRHTALFDRVYDTGERRWKHLVAFASSGLKPAAAAKRRRRSCDSSSQRLASIGRPSKRLLTLRKHFEKERLPWNRRPVLAALEDGAKHSLEVAATRITHRP